MLLIDKYAYMNRWQHIHPIEKIVLAFFLLLFSLTVKDTLVSLITFIVMSAFTILGAKIPFKYYFKLLLVPGFFLLSSMMTILISFTSNTILIPSSLWTTEFLGLHIFITKHSVETATQLFFTVLSSISCLYFLTLTTPVHDIMHVLRKLKVPALLIELTEITYRFIFVFLETSLKMHQAQNARLGYLTVKQSIHSLGLLVSSLFIHVFQRSKELIIAMNSRCYMEDIKLLEDDYSFSQRNWLGIVVISISIVAVYIQFGGSLNG
ncbi:cobalt ECF transporter T component CbiQ [Viridibacillus sp. YIM B01967]|uniref:Cobalt ECF transporter T component CbiQ n=1 Tax=Viridibacillus soli TaxID=2798301 RepID=A0ABS1H2V7_9BACL|nr:cobalt ECF transporter T component CbiQ [Viridibacillus soli]MBK3493725.1 cobalt ECF transporter T component CbiQ [Viridibacillus soli]